MKAFNYHLCILRIGLLLISITMGSHSFGQMSKQDSVILFKPFQQDSLVSIKMTPERVSRLLGKSTDGGSYFLITRITQGDVEIHEGWDDIAIVRSGHGILKTGKKLTGHKESGKAPTREWLGGVIQDGTERKLGPGDFIVIPALLAHQYIPVPGETFQYWVVKVKHAR